MKYLVIAVVAAAVIALRAPDLQEPTESPSPAERRTWHRERGRSGPGAWAQDPPRPESATGAADVRGLSGRGRHGGQARDQRAGPGPDLPDRHAHHPPRRRPPPSSSRPCTSGGGPTTQTVGVVGGLSPADRASRDHGRVTEPGLRPVRARALAGGRQGRSALGKHRLRHRRRQPDPAQPARGSNSSPADPALVQDVADYLGVLKAYQAAGLTPAQATQVDQATAGPGPDPPAGVEAKRPRRHR